MKMMKKNKLEQYRAKLVRDYKLAVNEVEFHWRNLQLNDRPMDRYNAILNLRMLQCKLELMEEEMIPWQA